MACPHLHCRVTQANPPNHGKTINNTIIIIIIRSFTKTLLIMYLPGMSSPSPVAQLNRDVEDDDVFMQLELPLEVFSSPFH